MPSFIPILAIIALAAQAQPTDSPARTDSSGVPVIDAGDTLFCFRAALGPFTAAQRAQSIEEKLQSIAAARTDIAHLTLVAEPGFTSVVLDSTTLLAVSDSDAPGEGCSWHDLALARLSVLRTAITRDQASSGRRSLIVRGGTLVLKAHR